MMKNGEIKYKFKNYILNNSFNIFCIKYLHTGSSDGRIIGLLECSDECVDGRITDTGSLHNGSFWSVENENGDSAKQVDIVKIVGFTLCKNRNLEVRLLYYFRLCATSYQKLR